MRTPITQFKLSQYQWLARGVEALAITFQQRRWLRSTLWKDYNEEAVHDMIAGMLPELLALVATTSPALKVLRLSGMLWCPGSIVESCASLTQITKLYLGYTQLWPNTAITQIQCLTNLHTLEVRDLTLTQHTAQKAFHHHSAQKQARFG